MTSCKIASLSNDSSISIYSSILPSGGKLLCQLFGDIFGVEVVWFVVVDGFVGRGGGLTGICGVGKRAKAKAKAKAKAEAKAEAKAKAKAKAKAEAGDCWENGAGGCGLAESVGVLRLRLPR